MTKIDWSKYPPIPGFNSLEWKRETQKKIYEEIKDMTWEEQRERLCRNSEAFQESQYRYRTERKASEI